MRTDCRVTTQFGLYILFQLSGYTSDFRRTFHKLQLIVGCEGLELHILHRPHMDSIDLDPQPILGIGSDIY